MTNSYTETAETDFDQEGQYNQVLKLQKIDIAATLIQISCR